MRERQPPDDPSLAPRREWTAARLEAWRREIDAVDRRLLELLQHRGELVLRIARLKRQAGLTAHDPAREEAILAERAVAVEGPYAAEAVRRVFRAILDASLQLHDADPAAADEAVATKAAADSPGGRP